MYQVLQAILFTLHTKRLKKKDYRRKAIKFRLLDIPIKSNEEINFRLRGMWIVLQFYEIYYTIHFRIWYTTTDCFPWIMVHIEDEKPKVCINSRNNNENTSSQTHGPLRSVYRRSKSREKTVGLRRSEYVSS